MKKLFRFQLEGNFRIVADDEDSAVKLAEAVVNQHLICTEEDDMDEYVIGENDDPYWFANYVV